MMEKSLIEFGMNDQHAVLCTHSLTLMHFQQETWAPCCISRTVSEEASITLLRDRGEKICKT